MRREICALTRDSSHEVHEGNCVTCYTASHNLMIKFNPDTHIVGKVYDLTQDNMNAMIKAFEFYKKLWEEKGSIG